MIGKISNNLIFRSAATVFLFVVILVTTACDNGSSVESKKQEKAVFQETHTLNDRVKAFKDSKQKANLFKRKSGLSKKHGKNSSSTSLDITKIAQVNTPVPGGFSEPFAASHIHWDQKDHKIYIAYTTSGSEFGGGVDVLDDNVNCYSKYGKSNCWKASFVSSLLEIGAVTTGYDYFYASGSVDKDRWNFLYSIFTGKYNSPAVIYRTPIDNFTIGQITSADLASQTSTDLKTFNGNVFATSAAGTGKFYKLDKDLNKLVSSKPSNSDLRSIASSQDKLFLLNGDGQLYSTPKNSSNLSLNPLGDPLSGLRSATIAKISYGETDNKEILYVPLNDGGFAAVNAQDGNIIDQRSQPYYSGITVNGKYVYAAAANTSGIINVFKWNSNGDKLLKIGHVELSGFQANLISSSNDYLFVANGEEGTAILEITDK